MKRKRYAPMVFAILGTIAMVFIENTAFAYRGLGTILLVGLWSRSHWADGVWAGSVLCPCCCSGGF